MKSTAKQRLLQRLQYANGNWVRGVELAEVAGFRFGGRIHELRQMGYVIERRSDPHSACDQYRLIEKPVQMEWSA